MNLIDIGMAMASTFALHNGDRVVFYGDSITEQRHYTTFAEAFVRTRYPNLDVRFFSRGWGGDASWGGGGGTIEQRVSQDVASLKPTMISVLLGMNDGGYVPYDPKIATTFDEWYGKLLDLFRKAAPGARFTCIETCPWDEYAHQLAAGPPKDGAWEPWDGYNEVLVHYADVVKKQAAEAGATFVDFNEPLVAVLKAARVANPALAKEIIPDSIHPGPAGSLVMAGALVQAWGFRPVMSSVQIDSRASIATCENTKVTNLNGLSWDQLDASLPLPLAPEAPTDMLAWKVSGLQELINSSLVKIDGLGAGQYRLTIDKKPMVSHSAEEWASGIDIGSGITPMREQALKVLELVQQRSDLDFFRWRTLQREHSNLKASSDAIKALDRMEEELFEAERKTAQPVRRHFELKKV